VSFKKTRDYIGLMGTNSRCQPCNIPSEQNLPTEYERVFNSVATDGRAGISHKFGTMWLKEATYLPDLWRWSHSRPWCCCCKAPCLLQQKQHVTVASHSASKEDPRLSWEPKVHYRVHSSPPLVPILSQLHRLCALSKIYTNVILLSIHRPSNWSLPFRFSNLIPAAWHAPRTVSLDHYYNIFTWTMCTLLHLKPNCMRHCQEQRHPEERTVRLFQTELG